LLFYYFFFIYFNFIFLKLKLFVCLGDFEVFFNYLSVMILGILVYNVINCFSFRDLLKRFGFLKISRRDFYECGFRPQTQKPIRLPIQFLLICVFFLLYDIELVFLFPYVSGIIFSGFYDFILLVFFFLLFLLSLIVDYERHALYWQY
jgi:NADH:ubiquinone oxidoreductase subunit 3 (subunit A)